MKKITSTKKLLFSVWISGFLLNTIFFSTHSSALEILAFFVITPFFIVATQLPNNKKYLAGLIFFGMWMVPTSFWYFNFMP